MRNELENISISSEYTGNGKIHMGNGISLPTSHIGHTSFRSFLFPSNSRILHLKNILHVPSTEQVADILTKPLSANQFNKLKMKLTVGTPYKFQGRC